MQGEKAARPIAKPIGRGREQADIGLRFPLLAFFMVLALLAALLPLVAAFPAWRPVFFGVDLGLVAVAAGLAAVMDLRLRRNVLQPLRQLEGWVQHMRAGHLTVRILEPQAGAFAALARDINGLGETLCKLSQDMEERAQKATRRIAQKTRLLEILCEVAATVNASRDLGQLLTKFLDILSELLEARAGVVRLLTGDGHLRLIASKGLDDEIVGRERSVALDQCACGLAASGSALQCSDVACCHRALGRPMFNCDDDSERDIEMVAVPLFYRGRVLGVYNLFMERPVQFPREDLNDLLTSIGRHLGTALEKARLDDEAKRLMVMEERTLLADELHDSLAQTLSSLRFQVRTLDDTLRAGDQPAALRSITRIAGSLDEAHKELRELLGQFRAPIDQSGVVAAIEKVTSGFARDTGIGIFFQQECHGIRLPMSMEMEILRIVQESLVNVRKHSRAGHVRVILRHEDPQDMCWVLVEDDGVGFVPTDIDSRPGEHLGLSIMEDRARRLGGSLKIESEIGEGTRVMVTFPLPREARNAIQGGPIEARCAS